MDLQGGERRGIDQRVSTKIQPCPIYGSVDFADWRKGET
jgi:hypothetical protein